MNSNTAGVAMVAGASSMIFWCRRWIEQSRPKRDTAFPYWSARICTSRCRACWASFMRNTGEPGISLCTCRGKQRHSLFPGKPTSGGFQKFLEGMDYTFVLSCTQMGDQKEVPDSWLQAWPSSLAFAAIWGMNNQMKDLSLYLPLHKYALQINKTNLSK